MASSDVVNLWAWESTAATRARWSASKDILLSPFRCSLVTLEWGGGGGGAVEGPQSNELQQAEWLQLIIIIGRCSRN